MLSSLMDKAICSGDLIDRNLSTALFALGMQVCVASHKFSSKNISASANLFS